jgi:hypothetical protein
VRVDSWKTNTAIVHLTGEDLIAEEVVSEQATVTVSKVVGFSHGNIGEITKKCVHAVVLLLDIVQVFCVFVNSE